jgi:GDP-L-fucose synthase
MDNNSKIFVAGHRGLVGSAIVRNLTEQGYNNIITLPKKELDLTQQKDVDTFFKEYSPDYVFLAAAKVGGILYNRDCPADFIRENLQIQTNVIDSAYRFGTKKLLFIGSACIYPKHAPVPIKEEYLMTGPLEETNIAYAIAKIAGYTMCLKYTEQYNFNTVSAMPTNLYGINDNFNINQSHVIPGLINKFVDAKLKKIPYVKCYGDGTPTREFLFADDLADGLIFLMNNHNDPNIINMGSERPISIRDLAEMIANIVGFEGDIIWDTTMPNGTPHRALDLSKMNELGWKAKTSLEEGLSKTIEWYRLSYGY